MNRVKTTAKNIIKITVINTAPITVTNTITITVIKIITITAMVLIARTSLHKCELLMTEDTVTNMMLSRNCKKKSISSITNNYFINISINLITFIIFGYNNKLKE